MQLAHDDDELEVARRGPTTKELTMHRTFIRLATAALLAATLSLAGAASATALTSTTISGQYGTVGIDYFHGGTHYDAGSAFVRCSSGSATVAPHIDTSINLYTSVRLSTYLTQFVKARAWIVVWNPTTQTWGQATWLNGGVLAQGTTWDAPGSDMPATLNTGTVTIARGVYYAINFEVYWQDPQNVLNAHRYYSASAGEYMVNGSWTSSAYCKV
jgi:hypothetical protein